MMQGVIDEAREVLREMPFFAAAVMVMVALGAGVRAAVFYEADGEDLRLIADRSEPSDAEEVSEARDPMMRMGARLECAEKIPGFTVIVGLSHYNVELSVPVRGMQQMFEEVRPDVARAMEMRELRRAA
ncbi:hypothetical protein [Edaphobacter aggregans]|uniref:hypothetical protein n=1 Tax=Edaphobacter aggregans TaxID=570835 RepID=UPI000556EE9E|nr:hypothetical protein [Edaphobacter aggregans]